VNLRDDLFAEGLARVDDHLFQLTWRENIAIEFSLATFEPIGFFQYEGEGWGLCYDGEYLFMSNGSSTLTKRDPETFQIVEAVPVVMRGEPIDQLNELECVNGFIYANIWKTNYIVQIDKETGHVIARIDASNLLTDEERAQLDSSAVLNGIAYDQDNNVFLITGKYWPKLFEVRFVTP
jgi:glutaminyl-peptide cyclotransferase